MHMVVFPVDQRQILFFFTQGGMFENGVLCVHVYNVQILVVHNAMSV